MVLLKTSNTPVNILIVDDEVEILQMLSDLLLQNHLNPFTIRSSSEIGNLFTDNEINIALIDLKLANESGLELAQTIRENNDIPIIMMTGSGDEVDKILGLELVADDYIMKPFNSRELIARIKAVLRRSYSIIDQPGSEASEKTPHQICFEGYTLDLLNRVLSNGDDNEIPLTNTEFRTLEFLLKNANRVVEREAILEYLGIDHTDRYVDRNIDVIIMRLRRKIEAAPSRPVFLQTRRHQGYIFIIDEPPHDCHAR